MCCDARPIRAPPSSCASRIMSFLLLCKSKALKYLPLGFFSAHHTQPIPTGSLFVLIHQYFHHITVINNCVNLCHDPFDFSPHAPVPDVGMHIISEVYSFGAFRQFDNVTLWRKGINVFIKMTDLRLVGLKIIELLHPIGIVCELVFKFLSDLIKQMAAHPILCLLMHLVGADLNFNMQIVFYSKDIM